MKFLVEEEKNTHYIRIKNSISIRIVVCVHVIMKLEIKPKYKLIIIVAYFGYQTH